MEENPQESMAPPGERLGRQVAELPRVAIIVGSSVAVFLAYFTVAFTSYAFVIPPSRNAVFWPATGMTFALFVRARSARWLWPGWILATFFAELANVSYHGIPLAVGLVWALVSVLAPLIGALLARRFPAEPFSFQRIRDVLLLVGLTAVCVVPGALLASAAAAARLSIPSFSHMTVSWASSDAIGIIVLAPVLLTWTARQPRPVRHVPEAVVLLLALGIFSWLVFHRSGRTSLDPALPSLLFVLVAWASIRFGPRATTFAMLILDVIAVAATSHGLGPFATSGLAPAAQLLNLQVLVVNLGLLMLLLAAAIEEQREARSVAEAATKVRDEFVSVAAHELYTPLTSLQLSVQALLDAKTVPPEAVPHMLDLTLRQVSKLNTLVGDLLDSTRIRQGRMPLQLEEIDLPALAREVAERAASLAARTGSTISIHADVPICGRWDRMRVDRILMNLVSNATKFGAGNPIEISVGLDSPGVARVVVQDHGIGIPPERLSHIFDRFQQVVAQRQYGGLGLGLFIARALVEQLGGSIDVVSTPGMGSTFTVTLPLLGPDSPVP